MYIDNPTFSHPPEKVVSAGFPIDSQLFPAPLLPPLQPNESATHNIKI